MSLLGPCNVHEAHSCAASSLPPAQGALFKVCRFGGAERRTRAAACPQASGSEADSDGDERAEAAEAAMLTEEEALIVTSRLHQVSLEHLGQLAAVMYERRP